MSLTRVPELEARFSVRVYRKDVDRRSYLSFTVVDEDGEEIGSNTIFSGSAQDADDIVQGQSFKDAAEASARRMLRQARGTGR